MRRRLRQAREIPFSFDSFLDVVANVVGIIIRLILVVWVGARSYSSLQVLTTRPARPATASTAEAAADPLQQQLAQHREELAQAQARLLEQLRQLQQAKDDRGKVESRFATVSAQRQEVEKDRSQLKQTA